MPLPPARLQPQLQRLRARLQVAQFQTLLLDVLGLGLAGGLMLRAIEPCVCQPVGADDVPFKHGCPPRQFMRRDFDALPRLVADSPCLLNLAHGDGLKVAHKLLQIEFKALHVLCLGLQRRAL